MPNLDSLASQLTHYLMSEPTFLADGTSIGEGLNTYMVGQFTQFGTTTLAVNAATIINATSSKRKPAG